YGRTRVHGVQGNRSTESEYVSVEAPGHTGGISVSLSMDLADETDLKMPELPLSSLRLRDESKIPSVPGFCIARSIFVEPLPAHTNEHIVMHLDLPSKPDLAMILFSIAGGNPGPGLLARVAHTDSTA